MDLYFSYESAWGGQRLLGTEGVSVALFNGGYALVDVALKVSGEDKTGREVCVVDHVLKDLPRGRELDIEVPSYEFPGPVHTLRLSLMSAEFRLDS